MNLGNVKIHCNTCLGSTKHTIIYHVLKRYKASDKAVNFVIPYEDNSYSLVECDGCESISLMNEITYSENFITTPSKEYYPPRLFRKEPEWMLELIMQDKLDNPYKMGFFKEIYIALQNDMPRLAVIGIRALLEQVMIENVGDHKSFKKNIDEFQSKGFISRVQREAIEPVINAGHASMHRGFAATNKEVIALMDVTENIIESIYINSNKVKGIDIPPKGV